ncbi:hypothetical protein FO519_000252 [Halicephalobus sp. NKZ332]|nr:hypothetical protein FO519_000252 [Halicephalobus sp. NKZ332]
MENVLPTIFQFIYDNERICGDLFADPNWLPAFEDCQLDCDISSQICQENVKKTFPGQRCMNLPIDCTSKIKRLLDLQPDVPALQLPLAPLTTFAPRTTIPNIHTRIRNITRNTLQPPSLNQIFRDSDSVASRPPSVEPMAPAYSRFSIDSTPPPVNYYATTPYYRPSELPDTDSEATTVPLDYEDERNLESQETSRSTGGGGSYMGNGNLPDTSVLSYGRFVNYETTMAPRKPPNPYGNRQIPSMERHWSPLSWNDLTYRLKKRPFYSVEDSGTVIDHSIRCCEWALDGLCDRSWQRVRQLCPKSCGTVVCASIEGALSCNRAIDVDVLNCFRRRKLALASKTQGNTYRTPIPPAPLNPPNSYRRSGNVHVGSKKQKPEDRDYALSRVFAIENEIQVYWIFKDAH